MNELVQLLVSRTGISQDQAQQVVQVVMSHLESKLPPEVSGIVNGILSGQQSGMVGEAESILSGFFHKPS